MGEKRSMGKVYEFTPGKKRKLKSLDYVSPEKKELLRKRKQAKKDKSIFYAGVWVFLLLVVIITIFRIR
ncbi:MAG: hypothetical protein ACOX86_09375 [Pelotomaculaceae bacterium]|jgi:hypothetical protein|uniref:Uncharacterized protein n=1 Tax=anaerobic digester metagenome TaxID=1263854 RepID=A0A485LZN3_9ZZZZ|nr:hypothetical protein [Bacillota bacterium]HHU86285.1 hypothetical protein [Peptococcaceae bacterium]